MRARAPLKTLRSLLAVWAIVPIAAARADVDVSRFAEGALAAAPETVDCTLTTGEATRCARLVVKYKPDGLAIGPFCPGTLDEVGGIWDWDGEGAGLYRLDGAFFDRLAAFGFEFADDEGRIAIADPAAGPPGVDHACLEAGEDASVEMTVLIPLTPQMAESPTDLATVAAVGLALDGVPIFADAPSVLDTGHLPALDTCGGHVDPGGWYHWHATSTDIDGIYESTGIEADCALPQSAGAQFGYAFDGHAMFGTRDADGAAPTDLDACNGHVSATPAVPAGEYHYHATDTFPNLPPCLVGVQATDQFVTTASGGIGAAGGPGGGAGGGAGGMLPGFDDAATTLGVSEATLMQAIRDAGGRDLDVELAAEGLGVTVEALREALPSPP